jgi:Arc/MetJ-type ribon-helix-helix transcriptional regulator
MHAILCESPLASYDPDMNDMTLPPELERFAAEAIAAGGYRDKAELFAAGVDLVRRLEAERTAFVASLEAAEADTEQNGTLSLDEVMADMDRIIEAAEHRLDHANPRGVRHGCEKADAEAA